MDAVEKIVICFLSKKYHIAGLKDERMVFQYKDGEPMPAIRFHFTPITEGVGNTMKFFQQIHDS